MPDLGYLGPCSKHVSLVSPLPETCGQPTHHDVAQIQKPEPATKTIFACQNKIPNSSSEVEVQRLLTNPLHAQSSDSPLDPCSCTKLTVLVTGSLHAMMVNLSPSTKLIVPRKPPPRTKRRNPRSETHPVLVTKPS